MTDEQVFDPALRRVTDTVVHALEEHQRVRSLVGDAQGGDPASADFAAKVQVLGKTSLLQRGVRAVKQAAQTID